MTPHGTLVEGAELMLVRMRPAFSPRLSITLHLRKGPPKLHTSSAGSESSRLAGE
jgi:hypothetical protein